MTRPPRRSWRRLARSAALSARLLAAHRLRTLLSVAGLVVGVATVMVMAAVGQGAERRLLEQVRAMGTDLVVIRPAQAPRVAGRAQQSATLTTFRPADVDAIRDESGLAREAAGEVRRTQVVRWEGRNTTTTVSGTTVEGLTLRNMSAATGRVFDDDEDRQRRLVAVVGRSVVRTLFGEVDPVGLELRIGNTPFEVIGVLAPRGTDPGGADLDHVVVIPLETAMRRVLNVPYLDAIYIQARSSDQLDPLEREVLDIMTRRHRPRAGAPSPFVVLNQAVLLRTERGTAQAMEGLILGVSSLALVVGGIGIVALSLLSLRERTREIGLRRAVGARRTDIRLQFLVESGMLGILGGGLGVLAGVAVGGLAALLGPWDLVLSWRAAGLGLLGSVALGLTVGVIPAMRAARLDPITALRRS